MSQPTEVVTERRAFFTPRTLAAYLALSERTIRQMLADHVIPSYLIQGSRRVDPADVDAYLSGCRNARTLGAHTEAGQRRANALAPAPKE